MKNGTEQQSTAAQPRVSLEQFLIKPTCGRRVVVTNNPEMQLQEASESAVGEYGADGAIVWVLLDVNADHHHVLVDDRHCSGLAAIQAAIEQLTLVQNQMMRLEGC